MPTSPIHDSDACDICIIGAGAAGLFAAIWAGRTASQAGVPLKLLALDAARSLGAKILVAGGGRCNVTHHSVSERDFWGSTPAARRLVLRSFPVDKTVQFFRDLGVELKREETGKLFPVTDSAKTVLDALVTAATSTGVTLIHPARVASCEVLPPQRGGGFLLRGEFGCIAAQRVVLAAGGCSLPKSGSDGSGLAIAQTLGHTSTPHVVPALVPLLLPSSHWITALAGISINAGLILRTPGTRPLVIEGSVLCTHFGISGPAVLDMSRHWRHAVINDSQTSLSVNWSKCADAEAFDADLLAINSRGIGSYLQEQWPERFARAICHQAKVPYSSTPRQVSREARRTLALLATSTPLPVTGDRGWNYAEVTAGGVPLSEVDLGTMESRRTSGLYLCGEVLDVDGRIGGFNFQWAWASGYLAGTAAARALATSPAG
ncbi:MAG: aminoacetone oxidase family FAD-binding enzyme [Phycisphaerales bacterium]|nr:aminoacetone oxidase family FAD-binding enzyme [Phycisphaerales bacterium]